MPKIQTTVETPIRESFRTAQVAGMFDLPPDKVQRETFTVEVPSPDEPWQIGAIVGPSGSGKSTVARAAYTGNLHREGNWDPQAAIVDQLGEGSIKQITSTLTAVGLGSPPAWLRPFAVLSTGEQFRVELARALLNCGMRNSDCGFNDTTQSKQVTSNNPQSITVFDEFTSTVDRTVARVASATVARAIRCGHVNARLVAVTCHRDVLPWLEPDWIVDMSDQTLTWYSDNCGVRIADCEFNNVARSKKVTSNIPKSAIKQEASSATEDPASRLPLPPCGLATICQTLLSERGPQPGEQMLFGNLGRPARRVLCGGRVVRSSWPSADSSFGGAA